MKIAIIGNGILGMMTARAWLQTEADVDIHIIGPVSRNGSATRAAAAMLNSFSELEHDSLSTPLDRFKFELSRAATAAWPAIFEELCTADANITHGLGTYILNNTATDTLDDDNYDAVKRFADEFDEPYESIDPRDIPNYNPDPHCRALRALFLKREGWINPKQFLDALTAHVASHKNVTMVDASVTRLITRNHGIHAAELDNATTIEADQFVLANGAHLGSVLNASNLGLSIQPMFFGIGMSIEMQSQENVHTQCVRTTNRGLACGVYTVPYGKDRTLVGASNYISTLPHDHAHVGSAYGLLKSAMEQINNTFYRANLVTVNVGWRPTTSDTYPLFGKTGMDNLWILGGTKRDGFHLSPILCRDLVMAMRGEPIDARYKALAPERPLIRSISREAAISKTIRHQINAAYQHDFVSAKNRMVEQLQRAMRTDLEALHDKIGATDWGIPPELIDMYRYQHIPGKHQG